MLNGAAYSRYRPMPRLLVNLLTGLLVPPDDRGLMPRAGTEGARAMTSPAAGLRPGTVDADPGAAAMIAARNI